MAIPKYKDIVDLVKKGSTIEAQEKIMELREATIDLQEENIELKSEVKRLQYKLSEKEQLNFDGEVYYLGQGEQRDGPFCSPCKDTKDILVRVHPFDDYYMGPRWRCNSCEKDFKRDTNT